MATGRADFWYGRPFVVVDVPLDGDSEDAPTANWAYNHAVNPSAHHVRYSDAEAVLAMGPIGNLNPLNHNRYNDGEAQDAMGILANYNPMNHNRYTDGEADARIAVHAALPSVHHTAFVAADADTKIATHTAIAAAHHTRYADSEAVTAMGAKANSNPLNHDRHTNAEIQALCGGGFVNRGDPSASDYTTASFTKDGTWRDLNLSGIVPAGAKAVLLTISCNVATAGFAFNLRKNGNSYDKAIAEFHAVVANSWISGTVIVAVDTNRVCEYNATSGTWGSLFVTVVGWWL